MNELEKELFRTHKRIDEATADRTLPVLEVVECTSCGIWDKVSLMKVDLDGHLICRECHTWYGP